MKVIFIAGPYRSPTVRGIVENIRKAEKWAIHIWQLGGVALCPHLNTALMDGACPDSVWLEGALELLRRSDAVFLMPKWQESQGAKAEQQEAKLQGIPMFTEEMLPHLEWFCNRDKERCGSHFQGKRCLRPVGHPLSHEGDDYTWESGHGTSW